MYFAIFCPSPLNQDNAVIQHKKDHPFRSWHSGTPFSNETSQPYKQPPAQPVRASIAQGDEGFMAEFWDNPIPLMTKRLYDVLVSAGVDNLDVYDAVIQEMASGRAHENYCAFNLIGKVAAADLALSKYSGTEEPLIDGGFSSIRVDDQKVRGLLFFRLAEAVNTIVVHETVRNKIEIAGINTISFVSPEHWGT